MIRAAIKMRVFDLFCTGKTLRAIAAMDEMPCRATLEKWSAREGWVQKRTAAHANARKKATDQRVPELAMGFATLEAQGYRLAAKALAQLQAVMDGEMPAAALPMSPAKLARLVAALTKPGK